MTPPNMSTRARYSGVVTVTNAGPLSAGDGSSDSIMVSGATGRLPSATAGGRPSSIAPVVVVGDVAGSTVAVVSAPAACVRSTGLGG